MAQRGHPLGLYRRTAVHHQAGEDVAVVIVVAGYRRLRGETMDFKEFMLSAPNFDDDFVGDLARLRSAEPARKVDLTEPARNRSERPT